MAGFLVAGRFLPPGILYAAHEGVADPDVIPIKDCLEDQLNLFGDQLPPAEGLHDDAEGALDMQTEFQGLLARKLVVE